MFDSQGVPGESGWVKEQRRWNTPKSQGGMRPDHFEEFPKMVYKARRPDHGGPILAIDPRDERFSEQNCKTVGNEQEERHALEHGWRASPAEAVAHAVALEDAVATAAAERQNADKRLGERARAEAAAVDDASSEHVPEVTPQAVAEVKKRRGRPPKNAA